MDETETTSWEARSRAYRLLAHLVLRGPRQVGPALEAVGIAGFPTDPDEAAADHHRWLNLEILPWESVYLTADRLLGSPRTEPLIALGAALPLLPSEPDHLGRELEIAGLLCGAVADAVADGRPSEATRVRGRLTAFLCSHLAAWADFPARAAANAPGWGEALGLACELVREHGVTPVLPEAPPSPLSGSLRDIAEWLATPLATGVAWTHLDLAQAGSQANLPCGFGSRADQLESLLRNAVDHRRLGDALAAIDRHLAGWEAAWGGSPWAPRTLEARAVLSRLAAAPLPPSTS